MLNALMTLSQDGSALSYDEHGWGPSSIYMHYRDKGLLTGEIKEIFWTGNGNFRVHKK